MNCLKVGWREQKTCQYLISLKVLILEYKIDIMPNGRIPLLLKNQQTIEVIKTPYFPQHPEDKLCYVCSLMMVLTYLKNEYPDERINREIPNLTVDDIKRITRTRTSGTREENLIRDLENAVPQLKFEIIKNTDFSTIKESLDRNIPVIVLYCGDYLLNREKGGGHAGVVVGMTDDKIILNNPWFGYQYVADKSDFQDAWDLEYRALIKITVNPQTRLTEVIQNETQ